MSRAAFTILAAFCAPLPYASARDLGGQTIDAPPPSAQDLSNGTVRGSIVVHSGSVLRNLVINGDVSFDQPVDGLSVVHCSFRRIETYQHVTNATIQANVVSCGIGPDKPFTGLFLGNPGSNLTITDNLFRDCHEGLHLQDGDARGGVAICYNEFTGIQRHGIEVQCQLAGGLCQGNYLHRWRKNPGDDYRGAGNDSHIAGSWACGPNRDQSAFSTGCRIVDNLIVFDGDVRNPIPAAEAYLTTAIEWMGDGGTVAGNYVVNAGTFGCHTWTRSFTSSKNVGVGVTRPGWYAEPGKDLGGRPNPVGDAYFAANDPNAPARPTAGPRVTPGPIAPGGPVVTPAVTPATQPATIQIAGKASAPGQLRFTWQPIEGATYTYSIAAKGDASKQFGSGTLPAGASSVASAGTIPNTWEVVCTLTASNGATGTCTTQYLDADVPPAPVVVTPPVVVPATQPTLMHTITTYSDGTVKVDGQ